MEFSTQVRVMRSVSDMSQRDLSALTGIPNTNLSDFERGKALPSPEWSAAIRDALNWPPEALAELGFALLDGTIGSLEELRARLCEVVG